MSHRFHSLAKKTWNCFLPKRQHSELPEIRHAAWWNPVGKWTPRYQAEAARVRRNHGQTEIPRYGRIVSYQLAALFLEDCKEVEDWGCGYGTFRSYCLSPKYTGIDGSESPGADYVRDLRNYTSDVQGIFLRHVLEHNPTGWRQILLNALQSFSNKMVLAIYTPFGDVTRNVRKQSPHDITIPVALSFRQDDITRCFPPEVSWFTIVGEPLPEYETVFFLKKGFEHSDRDRSKQAVCYVPDFSGDL